MSRPLSVVAPGWWDYTTLDDAILSFLKEKIISPEEAFSKANDKSKFIGFLESPPEDFTEACASNEETPSAA